MMSIFRSVVGSGLRTIEQLPVYKNSWRHGTSIQVILLDKMEKRGEKGDIVTVKRGFARNFLIPRKLAGELSISRVYYSFDCD